MDIVKLLVENRVEDMTYRLYDDNLRILLKAGIES